jgi:hypothetical protein
MTTLLHILDQITAFSASPAPEQATSVVACVKLNSKSVITAAKRARPFVLAAFGTSFSLSCPVVVSYEPVGNIDPGYIGHSISSYTLTVDTV